MCRYDDYVSPYLRRPLRNYEQFLREQAGRAGKSRRDERIVEIAPDKGRCAHEDARIPAREGLLEESPAALDAEAWHED